MTVELSKPFGANSAVDGFDVRQIKKTLNRLGYYSPYDKTGITGIPDKEIFEGLKKFQEDFGLRVTSEARPDDETVRTLNREAAKTPDGFYIWRTVEDSKVRANHAQYNRAVPAWSDSPDPGEDYNCRCWAEPAAEENIYPDAIHSAIGPFDILAVFAGKGGIQITTTVLRILKDILRENSKLNETQARNLARFIQKIPANSKNSVKVTRLLNGNVKFTATSPGKIRGSWATYEKIADREGRTLEYVKKTYDNKGNLIHTKNKYN